ncbi:hypothetical protein BH09ACT8_BH09ACT8_31050 [soil metagenome]
MLIRWPREFTRESRIGALIIGGAAAVLIGVAGCTTVIDGSGGVDTNDAPVYKASVTASIEESASSSSAKETERQLSSTTQAVHSACETMSTSSADAVDALNAFVASINTGADPTVTEGPAGAALNNSADLVATSINSTLPQDLQDAFNAYSDAARSTATALLGHLPPADFNAAATRLNDTRANALNLCDAAY